MNGDPINRHDDVLGLTDAYVHGLLDPHEARFVDERVAESAVWRAALDEARARAEAVRAIPIREPSEALLTRAVESSKLRGRRRAHTRRVFTRVIPAIYAAAALVLLVTQLFYQNLSPRGYDLTVLGQSSLAAGGPGSVRVRLLDRAGGHPIADAPVEVSLAAPDGRVVKLASFVTDGRGTGSPRYTIPDWTDGEYTIRITAAGRESIERPVTLRRPTRLMLSTDKPVYQPGQTIRIRALALRRADGRPMAGEEAVFTIADPKGTIIFKQRSVTSDFGITSADCPLADEILHGAYTLRCTIAGTESERTLDVEPYLLPKFRVGVGIDEPYLRPGQFFHVDLSAAYFFGQPVAGATAAVEVAAPDGGFAQSKAIALDERGNGRAEFRLPERLVGTERDSGDARLTITATITDSGGQAEARTITRVVAARELRIEVIPESGTLIPGVANRIYVLVTTPDGRPAAGARLSIAGVDHEITASELGVASFDLTPPGPDADMAAPDVLVTLTATDAAGRRASRSVNLSGRVVGGDFLLRTDAAAYVAGATMTIDVLGAGSEPVFLDLLKDGQTVLTRVVDVKDGRGELPVDLPADLTGTLELVAYRFDAAGVAARRTRAVVVQGADELHVEVSTDKAQYRPGERARIRLEVTGSGGAPAPGAVSIAAVDEAVYSVIDQAPGLERTLMTLDERLLRPVYTLYPWTMNPRGNAAQRELDRALFGLTAERGPADRRAALRYLVENGSISQEMLDVLESPRADRLISSLRASGAISADAASALRGQGGTATHTLSDSTWPGKVVRVQERRREAARLIDAAWVVLVFSAVLLCLAALVLFIRSTIVDVLVVLCLIALAIGFMLPALGQARKSSVSAMEMSSIRGIGAALDMGAAPPPAPPGGVAPLRVRDWFPETLLWRPEVITDDEGHATIDVDLADSITTWRLLGGAVTRDGRLGSLSGKLAVFQPFFVDINAPLSLTRNDEVSVPIVVYNYLDSPQTVRLSVKHADWCELLDDAQRAISLPAKAVVSTHVRLRARLAGAHEFEVAAVADGASDAIRRTIEVLPGGRPIEHLASGSLAQPLATDFTVPSDVIDSSAQLFVKIYPSPMSQFVEGLEGIFREPHGCFEQTSSTTYPNVLALQYLRQAGKSVPSVEATARRYIHLGYQRLLTFETKGGGFDWFGRPPANCLLTAYGLMEFRDMAKVHDVDPALIARTRAWLIAQRRADGSWRAEGHAVEGGARPRNAADADRIASAYVAWAVFAGDDAKDAAPTRAWLEAIRPETASDPYLCAMMAHALAAVGADERPWIARLLDLRKSSPDSKGVWWTRDAGDRTAFYGSGRSADIEATALATLALLQHNGDLTVARAALDWLTAQRNDSGTWGTTQATVLALNAIVAAADSPLGEPVERAFSLELDGNVVQRIVIPPDQAEVLKLATLSQLATPGPHRMVVRQDRGPTAQVQVVFRAAVPGAPADAALESGPLAVDVRYDRDALRVGDELQAVATLRATGKDAIPMVMLDLPIPPGFAPNPGEFDRMVASGKIARYETTPRTVIVYLTSLDPGAGLTLRYTMRATMPVSVQADAPVAYEYYNPASRARGVATMLRVESTMQ